MPKIKGQAHRQRRQTDAAIFLTKVNTHIHTYLHNTNMYACAHTSKQMHTHTHTHARAHTHTHTEKTDWPLGEQPLGETGRICSTSDQLSPPGPCVLPTAWLPHPSSVSCTESKTGQTCTKPHHVDTDTKTHIKNLFSTSCCLYTSNPATATFGCCLTLSHSDSLMATTYENLTAREITPHNIFTCKTK